MITASRLRNRRTAGGFNSGTEEQLAAVFSNGDALSRWFRQLIIVSAHLRAASCQRDWLTIECAAANGTEDFTEDQTMRARCFFIFILAVMLISAVSARAQTELPEGNGKKAVESSCVQCHDLSTVTRAGYSEKDWRNHV